MHMLDIILVSLAVHAAGDNACDAPALPATASLAPGADDHQPAIALDAHRHKTMQSMAIKFALAKRSVPGGGNPTPHQGYSC